MSVWDRLVTWFKRLIGRPTDPKPHPRPPPEPEPALEPERVTYGGHVVTYDGEDVTYGIPVS